MASLTSLMALADMALKIVSSVWLLPWLPLGGSDTSQTAICLSIGFVADEFMKYLVDVSRKIIYTSFKLIEQYARQRQLQVDLTSNQLGYKGPERRKARDRRAVGLGGRRVSDTPPRSEA